MKKIILIAAAAMVGVTCAIETNWNAVVAATRRADGSTNKWTQADLQDALGLLNRKYWRDMESPEGRRKWHGTMKPHYVTNAAERTVQRIEVYADGFTNVVKGAKRKLRTPEEEAVWMLERRNRRARASASWIETLRAKIAELEAVLATSTNDLERARATIDLYAARRNLARAEAAQTNVVDVIVQPVGTESHSSNDAYSTKDISPYALIWNQELIDKQVEFYRRLAEVTGVEWGK